MRHPLRQPTIAILVGVLLGAVGCGGEPPEPEGQPTAAVTATPPATPPVPEDPPPGATDLTLTAEGMQFDKEELSVEASSAIRLTLRNEDSVPHNFALYATELAEESFFVGETITGPDASTTYNFGAPDEVGTYFFRCDVHPTTMTGTFRVG